MEPTEDQRQKLLRQRAQYLRTHMTPEEKHLWYDFLKKHPAGFHSQYIIKKRYILDFYCRTHRLCVELDGSQHSEEHGKIYDTKRTAFLEKEGIRVIRFTNLEIWKNFNGVCNAIHYALRGEW